MAATQTLAGVKALTTELNRLSSIDFMNLGFEVTFKQIIRI